jgi:hypothetical protein
MPDLESIFTWCGGLGGEVKSKIKWSPVVTVSKVAEVKRSQIIDLFVSLTLSHSLCHIAQLPQIKLNNYNTHLY